MIVCSCPICSNLLPFSSSGSEGRVYYIGIDKDSIPLESYLSVDGVSKHCTFCGHSFRFNYDVSTNKVELDYEN